METFEKAKTLFLDGLKHFQNKKFQDAEYSFLRSLELAPNRASTLNNLAATQIQLKKFDEAEKNLRQLIDIDEKSDDLWLKLSIIYLERGQLTLAISYLERCTENEPHNILGWKLKAQCHYQNRDFNKAIRCFKKILEFSPNDFDAHIGIGAINNDLKDYEASIRYHELAIKINPNSTDAYVNMGVALSELNKFDFALQSYTIALDLNPADAETWSNKGLILDKLKRYEEAIAHYDKALSLKPEYAEIWSNKGNTLHELKRYDQAIAHFDKALSLKPQIEWVFGDLVHTKMKICSWSGLANSMEIISQKVMANEKVIQPFGLLALSSDTFLHKKSSEIYVQSRYPLNPVLGPILKRPQSQKIRVGYFSADFRNHAVSILTAELYELHDKNKFEIIAFSFGVDDKSPMRSRLQQAFNQFIDVSNMSDLKIAQLARELGIDIAVDLGGLTTGSRTEIFSYRAAPVQLSYIGYLGTMGAEYYDYLLADKTIIPENLQKLYSEKIVYLASYQANDGKRIISEREFTKKELWLPKTGFAFCCFNNNYKILPSTFDSWMRILNAVEGSVFFLYADNERAKAYLIDEAILRGVNSERLVFGGRLPKEEYLARYRVCDLFLDTFPYNAGTTASDALWAGLPVLTLMGQSFASRVAASLLNAIGLPELITNTQEEYEALAIELAMNPQKLRDIKLKLARNRLTTPLFDTPLFTKNLEAAYIKMYERYHKNLEPDHITIA